MDEIDMKNQTKQCKPCLGPFKIFSVHDLCCAFCSVTKTAYNVPVLAILSIISVMGTSSLGYPILQTRPMLLNLDSTSSA